MKYEVIDFASINTQLHNQEFQGKNSGEIPGKIAGSGIRWKMSIQSCSTFISLIFSVSPSFHSLKHFILLQAMYSPLDIENALHFVFSFFPVLCHQSANGVKPTSSIMISFKFKPE